MGKRPTDLARAPLCPLPTDNVNTILANCQIQSPKTQAGIFLLVRCFKSTARRSSRHARLGVIEFTRCKFDNAFRHHYGFVKALGCWLAKSRAIQASVYSCRWATARRSSRRRQWLLSIRSASFSVLKHNDSYNSLIPRLRRQRLACR